VNSLVLGVIGHVDHGKTALVRALTGVDTDRLPEERRRGISIALGFAHLAVDGLGIDFIDMPGHERFVRTMISGATGIDAVLLVVAANEGIKPQTVEHVEIAHLLGLRRAVVAVSKADLADAREAARIGEQALRLLVRSGLDPLPPVATSALEPRGIEELRRALETLAAEQRPRAADGVAFLPIDRAFSVPGHGPVVTGTLRGASVGSEDALELLPSRRMVRVRALEVHGARVPRALPGQRVALNVRDVDLSDLARGVVLAAPNALSLSEWLTMSVAVLPGAPALKNGMRLRALLGTQELDVRLRLLDRDALAPAEHGFAQLHCAQPVALPAGEHAVLRLPSPPRTVAGGRILEPSARRERRHSKEILARLDDLSMLPPPAMIAREIERRGPAGTTLEQLSRLSALAVARVVELLEPSRFVVTAHGTVLRKTDLDRLLAMIPPLLARSAAGLSQAQLLADVPGTGAALVDEALARLLASGAIIKHGNQLSVPRPDQDRRRARDEAALASHIAETLRRAGLTPPTPGDLVTSLQTKRAVDRLLREGVIVRGLDRAKGREILFHQEAIADAQRRLAPLLERAPGLLVTEIGSALGISRKYSLPLLDHLDAIRFTRRVNDRRILGARPA